MIGSKGKILLPFITVGSLFLLIISSVDAAPYTDEIRTVYHVNSSGTADVEQRILIERGTQKQYPLEFTVDTKSEDVSDIYVVSEGQELLSTLNGNSITVQIPQEIGVKQTIVLQLYYSYGNFATLNGLQHEILVPVVVSSEDVSVKKQEVSIVTPIEWGDVSYVSQFERQTEHTDTSTITTIEVVPGSTFSVIEMAFGNEQWYHIRARYVLVNTKNTAIRQEIALIPLVENYQDVYIQSIEPSPLSVRVDTDDNVLALYELEARSTVEVVFAGNVRLYAFENSIKKQSLDNKATYTIPDIYWESNSDEINTLLTAEELTTPRQIFDYVSNNLTYSTERALTDEVFRFGAIEALNNKDQAVCMEYTDLMIALLRAADIPAREVNGYAYFSGHESGYRPTVSDELHSWVEYWDEQYGWRFVDPTWAATTGSDYFSQFDLRHIVFVKHGVSSQFPLPAGAYRLDNDASRYVNIKVLTDAPNSGEPILDWVAGMNQSQRSLWERFWRWLIGLLSGSH